MFGVSHKIIWSTLVGICTQMQLVDHTNWFGQTLHLPNHFV